MVRYLEGPLRWAVAQQLLLDPGSVQITEELVSSILELLELGVGHTLRNMCNDFGVEIESPKFRRLQAVIESC